MSVVLDSSAVLAVIFDEDGAERVAPIMDGALLSVVNLAEIATKLVEKGYSAEDVRETCANLDATLVPLDEAQAVAAGLLRARTGKRVSLGDRCCLALAATRSATAVTGDRPWAKLDVGVAVELIR